MLAELDGSISLLRCAAFRVAPYYPRLHDVYDVTGILADGEKNLSLLNRLDMKDGPGDIDDEAINTDDM